MKTLLCKCGNLILLDDIDFERLSQFTWQCTKHSVRRSIRVSTGVIARPISVDVMGGFAPSGHWDHKDRNPHNNQRENLRDATKEQNARNQGKRKGKNLYKGVVFRPRPFPENWEARIYLNNKCKSLGYYLTPELAARAYDQAAIRYFGEFAATNFPREEYATI